jgi:hypothetical protein
VLLRPALNSGKECEDLLQLKKGIVYIAWLCNLVLTYFITIGITVTETSQFGTFPEKLSNFRPFYDIVYQLVQFQSCQQKNSNQIYNQLKSYFSKGVSV